jgi:DNA-binding IclR family transcriptional regulator
MRRDPIKSAARTLEILELFQEQRTPLRLTYIFEKLGYPQSSTTTLLKSMVVLGYLNYDRASRTYFPTPRVAALGDWVNHHLFGSGDIDRLVTSIFEQTNETVVISSQNDIFIQHLRIIQPTHPYKVALTEGSMRVLPHSAAGLVLMSQMQVKAVDKLCRHINAYLGGTGARIDITQLQEQLAWVRRLRPAGRLPLPKRRGDRHAVAGHPARRPADPGCRRPQQPHRSAQERDRGDHERGRGRIRGKPQTLCRARGLKPV